jgi:hypothetical protein
MKAMRDVIRIDSGDTRATIKVRMGNNDNVFD